MCVHALAVSYGARCSVSWGQTLAASFPPSPSASHPRRSVPRRRRPFGRGGPCVLRVRVWKRWLRTTLPFGLLADPTAAFGVVWSGGVVQDTRCYSIPSIGCHPTPSGTVYSLLQRQTDSASTSLVGGSCDSVWVPSPSWPEMLRPQQRTHGHHQRANCDRTHAMAASRLEYRSAAANRCVVVPSPTSTIVVLPPTTDTPFVMTRRWHVVRTDRCTQESTSVLAGVKRSVLVPSPSWPNSLLPQQRTPPVFNQCAGVILSHRDGLHAREQSCLAGSNGPWWCRRQLADSFNPSIDATGRCQGAGVIVAVRSL